MSRYCTFYIVYDRAEFKRSRTQRLLFIIHIMVKWFMQISRIQCLKHGVRYNGFFYKASILYNSTYHLYINNKRSYKFGCVKCQKSSLKAILNMKDATKPSSLSLVTCCINHRTVKQKCREIWRH